MSERVTIKDIAEAAEVSITTVSHALSGKGRLPDPTRERVQAIAEELGYRPNANARGLAKGLAMTIAVQLSGVGDGRIMPDFAYFIELLNTASAESLRRGYGLIVVPTNDGDGSVRQLSLDGAIIVDPTGEESLLQREGLRIVTTGRPLGAEGRWPVVDNDHREGARTVLDHFVDVGYERPALLTTKPGQSYVDDTVAAYREWCKQHGIEPVVGRIDGSPTEQAAEPTARELLGQTPRPDAIYVTLDRAAVGVLRAARALNLDVPADLGVAAVTDGPMLTAVDPPITALNLDAPQIGRRAVDVLIAGIEDPDAATSEQETLIPSALICRLSSNGPRRRTEP